MDILLQSVKLEIDEKLYVKDPESSDLGKKIVEQSILLRLLIPILDLQKKLQ